MVESYDVGSVPPKIEHRKLYEIFKAYESGDTENSRVLKKLVVESFLDKIHVGLDVPNYPQLRDMNQMFLEMIDGLEKLKDGYVETESLKLKPGKGAIPEVQIIENNSRKICETTGGKFKLKICITGPYTLSTLFAYKNEETFLNLGRILAEIAKKNIFSNKFGKVSMVTVDEPTFGVMSDPMVDYGSAGREALLKAWETIFKEALKSKAVTGMHLHSTADKLFWNIESLKVVESHVEDPLYSSAAYKRTLEECDKFLKASICRTDYDQLIRVKTAEQNQRLSQLELDERVAGVWKKVRKGILEPKTFLENEELIKKRLEKILKFFGAERVVYAGPECGLGGFPTYETALECLRRVANVVKQF